MYYNYVSQTCINTYRQSVQCVDERMVHGYLLLVVANVNEHLKEVGRKQASEQLPVTLHAEQES